MTARPDDTVEPALPKDATERHTRRAALAMLGGALIATAGLFLRWPVTLTFRPGDNSTFGWRFSDPTNVFEWNLLVGFLLLGVIGVAASLAVGLAFFKRSRFNKPPTARAILVASGIVMTGLAFWARGAAGPGAVFLGGLTITIGGALIRERSDTPQWTDATTVVEPGSRSERDAGIAKRMGVNAVWSLGLTVVLIGLLFAQLASGEPTGGDIGVGLLAGAIGVVGLVIASGLGLVAILAGIGASSNRQPGSESPGKTGIVLGTIAIAPLVSVMTWGVAASLMSPGIPTLTDSTTWPSLYISNPAWPTVDGSIDNEVRFRVTVGGPQGEAVEGALVEVVNIQESTNPNDRPRITALAPPRVTDDDGAVVFRFPAGTKPALYTVSAKKHGYVYTETTIRVR